MSKRELQNGRWVKLWDTLLDSPIIQHGGLLRLWIWCLLEANWKDRKAMIPGTMQEIVVKRGQLITGRYALHDALYGKGRWKPDAKGDSAPAPITVWRWLLALADMGCVSVENVNNRCSLVTICKYETYQQDTRDQRSADDQPMISQRSTDDQLVINQRSTGDQLVITPKESKYLEESKEREEEKEKISFGAFESEVSNFIAIWNSTPGTQPIKARTDLGDPHRLIGLFGSPAWKINHIKALQKFPLAYFEPEGMHVLKFLQHDTVDKINGGSYRKPQDAPAGAKKRKPLHIPPGMKLPEAQQ